MVPRAGVAISSPNGVTRFWRGIVIVPRALALAVDLGVALGLDNGRRIGGREGLFQPLLQLLFELLAILLGLLAIHRRLLPLPDRWAVSAQASIRPARR